MRRQMAISAFALVLAVPLWAQHGGGHSGGGGGHFGGGGGHVGGSSGGSFSGGHSAGPSVHSGSGAYSGYENFGAHALSGARPESGYSPGYSSRFEPLPTTRSGYRGSYRGPLVNNRFQNRFQNGFQNNGFGNNGFRNGFRNNGFRNGYGRFRNNYCWGYVCNGYGYPWWGYYDPFLWWGDDDSAYDQDYQDNVAAADQMNQQSLEQQQMFDQEQADGDQDAYAQGFDQTGPPLRPAEPGRASIGEAAMSPTVLVFHDQHKLEVENYAIVGETLWAFSAHHTEKIPLSSLDLPATVKANDDRGVTFRIPASGEGQ
jgi:hypothetical protein